VPVRFDLSGAGPRARPSPGSGQTITFGAIPSYERFLPPTIRLLAHNNLDRIVAPDRRTQSKTRFTKVVSPQSCWLQARTSALSSEEYASLMNVTNHDRQTRCFNRYTSQIVWARDLAAASNPGHFRDLNKKNRMRQFWVRLRFRQPIVRKLRSLPFFPNSTSTGRTGS